VNIIHVATISASGSHFTKQGNRRAAASLVIGGRPYPLLSVGDVPTIVGELGDGTNSSWVFLGDDHRLHYKQDTNGNRIMDFSFAGYESGGVALPSVPAQVTLDPTGGDDTSAIQSAINAVSGMPPDANGFRGAIQLAAGSFNVSSTLNINASGSMLKVSLNAYSFSKLLNSTWDTRNLNLGDSIPSLLP